MDKKSIKEVLSDFYDSRDYDIDDMIHRDQLLIDFAKFISPGRFLPEVIIFKENNGPTSSEIIHAWFHKWVEKKVMEPVHGYSSLQSWIPHKEVTKTVALCETESGKIIFVMPENLKFKNKPRSIEYPIIEEEIH